MILLIKIINNSHLRLVISLELLRSRRERMLKTSDNNFAVIALEDSQHIVFMLYRCLGQWENRSCLVKIGHWKSCRSVPFQGRKPG